MNNILDKNINFILNKSVIKYIPKLKKRLIKIYNKSKKKDITDRQRLIYIIYYFDYSHLSLAYINKKNIYSNNKFGIYPKITNFSKKFEKLKIYLNCKGKYNNNEIIKIDGIKPLKWIKNKINNFNIIYIKNNKILSNKINNIFNLIYYHNINTLTLNNNKIINTNILQYNNLTKYKYKKFITKKINKNLLYIKIGLFEIDGDNNLYNCYKKLKKYIDIIKKFRDKNIIIDIRGNGGGNQETAYPFINAIFGKDIEELIKQKKNIHAIDYPKKIYKNKNIKINYNIDNKFSGKLFILMNYSSHSMCIIFTAWMKFLKNKYNINIIFIGTDINYQRGLSNNNIIKKIKEYNLEIKAPSRYIYKRGFNDMNIIYKPDYYYINEKSNNNDNPENNIPLKFINKLIEK